MAASGEPSGTGVVAGLASPGGHVTGLRLIAEVLPENAPMLQVLKKSGLPMMIKPVAEVVHVTLQLF